MAHMMLLAAALAKNSRKRWGGNRIVVFSGSDFYQFDIVLETRIYCVHRFCVVCDAGQRLHFPTRIDFITWFRRISLVVRGLFGMKQIRVYNQVFPLKKPSIPYRESIYHYRYLTGKWRFLSEP